MSEAVRNDLKIPDLAGKAVLITGSSTGIGAALARAFVAQGSRVGIHYHSSVDAATGLADELKSLGGDVFLTGGDVSVSANVERIVGETADHFGGLDGLINNAGLMLGRVAYTDMTDAQFDAVVDLNCRSVITASRAAHPHLKQKGGFIIHTTSIAARTGGSNGAGIYASAKGFVSTVTKGMAREFIADGIRVNAVAPGFIATPFHDRYSTPEQFNAAVAGIPQGRAGVAEDCVGAYLFLASDLLSGYMIGQIVEVNGGLLMP